MTYLRFGAMIATSTVVMFGLMYLNTYAVEHIFYSETRVYMALLMGATMAIIMLSFMLSMYKRKYVNIAIFSGSVIVFALSLWLVRSQATVSGVSFMRAMIPHHSIAIMTSERAQITDPRVRKLADEIIAAQQKEISEMRYLIAVLEDKETAARPDTLEGDTAPEVASVSQALNRAVIPTLDPAAFPRAQAMRALTSDPRCTFRRTAASDPVLYAGTAAGGTQPEGVIKLNGKLIPLQLQADGGSDALTAGPTLMADGVRVEVRRLSDDAGAAPDAGPSWDADLLFELERGLTVGYRGYYRCEQP